MNNLGRSAFRRDVFAAETVLLPASIYLREKFSEERA
jgi:hypothetical protein